MQRSGLRAAIFVLLFISAAAAAETPTVILVSFDGFRWDYADRGITPQLEFIKKNGVAALSLQPVFPSKTFPNHYSIVTGMYPENHGILLNEFTDPFTGRRYSNRDSLAVGDSRWYLGEAIWETAERQGLRTASYFWPGSEQRLAHRRPSFSEPYVHGRPYRERIEAVIRWLQLPETERPRLVFLYFDQPDGEGHRFGPNSPQVNAAVARVDSILGLLIRRLREIGRLEMTNLLIVSDHGMAEVNTERVVRIDSLLAGTGSTLFAAGGPVMLVQPQAGRADAVFSMLEKKAHHFSVYKRSGVPAYLHFSRHPFIPELVLVAAPGWRLLDTAPAPGQRGAHGYESRLIDMHGIFYAAGPAFKIGYRTGTIQNIDIYPLLCKLMGIMPRQNIDGRLERVQHMLRE